MGFFSNISKTVGDIFEEAGAAVGDVVGDVIDPLLGERGTRGTTLGRSIGDIFGVPELGERIGGALSSDISAAPDIYQQQQFEQAARRQQQAERVNRQQDQPVEQMFDTTQTPRTAGFPSRADEGTVIDIRYPRTPQQTIGDVGVSILEEVYDYFTGEDDNQVAGTGMMMCKPQMPKAFNVNRQTGCVTITRKQQAKLKEAVRMFGGAQVAKNLGISQQLLQQLLLKTFRARRKGISGADMRAVKRVDRQMHSLACALGGISQTSRAVASRKSPPKRSC